MTQRSTDELWKFFNYDNILQEAEARLIQARGHPSKWSAENKENSIAYWCAWVAHANLAACIADGELTSSKTKT